MASMIGTEARAIYHQSDSHGDYSIQKSTSCFAPMINILRHPLWGRVQEGYGEDPFLTGTLADAFVHGLQGDHPRYVRASAGCKHYAAHSGPENIPSSRFSFNAEVSERDLRLTFLPHFKRCVEAGSYNLMCSYNSINGIPACANKRLLTNIARDEFGFKGYFISDDGALENIALRHKYVNTTFEAVIIAAEAGLNMELPSSSKPYNLQLYEAVQRGLISADLIRQRVKPIFMTRMRLGHFDPPDDNPYSDISIDVVQSPLHRNLALVAARKSFVLLKNERMIPFTTTINTLAVVGPMADNLQQIYGSYAPNIDTTYAKTPYQGLKAAAQTVLLAAGCDDTRCKSYDNSSVINTTLAADVVVVCLGTGPILEEEDTDRRDLLLPGKQLQLLLDVINYAKRPVLLLIFSGGPLDVSVAQQSHMVGAIMQCFYPAQSTGQAIRDLLFYASGQVVSPSGRLPYTWPLNMSQVPPMTNYSMEGRTYRYFKGPGDPLYPFGYGLSYTKFNYSNLVVSPMKVKPGDNVTVAVTVTNLGIITADEVTQVYIRWKDCPVVMPQLQLVAFSCKTIKGKSNTVLKMHITADQLLIFDDTKGFVFFEGVIELYVGGQQPHQKMNVGSNILTTSLTLSR